MAVTGFRWPCAPFRLRSAAGAGHVVQGASALLFRKDYGSGPAARRDARDSRNTHSGFPFDIGRLLALGAAWLCVIHFGSVCAWAADLADADLRNPDVIALGKKRFNRSCFYCHGYEGSGGKGATLQRRFDLAPDAILNTISNGRIRGSSVMPPWKNTLTEEEIVQLVAYILSLREMPEQK